MNTFKNAFSPSSKCSRVWLRPTPNFLPAFSASLTTPGAHRQNRHSQSSLLREPAPMHSQDDRVNRPRGSRLSNHPSAPVVDEVYKSSIDTAQEPIPRSHGTRPITRISSTVSMPPPGWGVSSSTRPFHRTARARNRGDIVRYSSRATGPARVQRLGGEREKPNIIVISGRWRREWLRNIRPSSN